MKKYLAIALVLCGLALLRWRTQPKVAAADPTRRGATVEKPAVSSRPLPRPADDPRRPVTPLPSADTDDDTLVPAYRGVVVESADGKPIGDATVKLCRALGHDVLCEDELADAGTDEKGRFRIVWPPQQDDDSANDDIPKDEKGAPVEPKLLLVQSEDHATALVTGADLLRARRGDGVTVRLAPVACIHGVARDRDGKAIDGAQVDWYLASGEPGEGTRTNTESDGAFAIEGLAAEEVVVFARHEDEDGQMLTTSARVDLRAGGEKHVELVLRPVPRRTLAGRVTDRLGRPLSLVSLTVEPAAGNTSIDDRAMLNDETFQTNVAGEFEVPVATPGPFFVRVYALHQGLDELLAEAELRAVGGPATIAVWEVGNVRCRIRDALGRSQPITTFRALYRSPRANGVIYSSAADRPVDEVYFVWPRPVQSASVILHRSRAGRRPWPSAINLSRPDEACEATVPADT